MRHFTRPDGTHEARKSLSWGGPALPWILALLLLLVGCVTFPLAPPDTAAPGWVVRQGQALWRPRRDAPEVAGELVFASGGGGDYVVEFTKTPLTLVSAHRVGERWEVRFPTEARRVGGRGSGSERVLWLGLPPALGGEVLARPLVWSTNTGNAWRLENRDTGESIEGFLSP